MKPSWKKHKLLTFCCTLLKCNFPSHFPPLLFCFSCSCCCSKEIKRFRLFCNYELLKRLISYSFSRLFFCKLTVNTKWLSIHDNNKNIKFPYNSAVMIEKWTDKWGSRGEPYFHHELREQCFIIFYVIISFPQYNIVVDVLFGLLLGLVQTYFV